MAASCGVKRSQRRDHTESTSVVLVVSVLDCRSVRSKVEGERGERHVGWEGLQRWVVRLEIEERFDVELVDFGCPKFQQCCDNVSVLQIFRNVRANTDHLH